MTSRVYDFGICGTNVGLIINLCSDCFQPVCKRRSCLTFEVFSHKEVRTVMVNGNVVVQEGVMDVVV